MGNFYVNYTLKGASQQAVTAALVGRKAIVTPLAADALVVYDSQSDKQDQSKISGLASVLSSTLKCPVLAVMNHDDDILWYQLFESGKLSDSYDSCPDYFDSDCKGEPRGPTGGDAEKLCAAFGNGDAEKVEEILRKTAEDGYVFEFQRHADLVAALALPECAVGSGYSSFGSGELPDGLPLGEVIRTA